MAKYVPLCGWNGRGDKARLKPRRKPWEAMRRRQGRIIFLGYHETKIEAETAERDFDTWWPPKGEPNP